MATPQTITTASVVKTPSAILKFYNRFEHLAEKYAKQVFNYERYGYERQDIVQEFKIKLYTSIITYGEKLMEYKETGKYKPVPIEFYLKSAMVNKVKDFVRKLNLEEVANSNRVSIEDNTFDYSVYNDMVSELDLQKNVYIINGVNLLESLERVDKLVFALYLKGYSIRELKKKFKKVTQPEAIIRGQINYLKTYKQQLMDYKRMEFLRYYREENNNG